MTKKRKFSALFDEHYQKLYNYTYKVLGKDDIAQDLVHETFIKLWENFDTIKKNDRSISSFLIVTLKNKIIDHYRKDKVREKHTNQFVDNRDFQSEINTAWELTQAINIIYEALSPKTIQIFKLSREHGLTYNEISIKMGISVKTVEAHISTALKVFREGLKDYF